jgi:PleD family two-component response regulator
MTHVTRAKRTRFALPAHDDHRAVDAIDALIRAPAVPDDEVHADERGRGRAGAMSTFGGLDSRMSFLDALRREDERVRRYRRPAAVAVLEIVSPADELGRDPDLERSSWRLIDATTRIVRETDRVARVAPGTVHILLPETKPRQAERVVERIRARWEERMSGETGDLRLLTAVAAGPPGEGVLAGLARAEAAVAAAWEPQG